MNRRTRSYLEGRFRDYYRRHQPREEPDRSAPLVPPGARRREWAHIPFREDDRTVMLRHQRLVEGDSLGGFLVRQRPRHVYHSTAYYDDPDADAMAAKGWRGADLVFDLDADHLPDVDPDADSFGSMLTTCRGATFELVEMLESEFAFDDLSIVFSGNRGFHVHVRDDGVGRMDRHARREVVEYVRGEGLAFDAIVTTESVGGSGGVVSRRRLYRETGWGRRVSDRLTAYLGTLRERPDEEVLAELESFEDIGPDRAATVARVIDERWETIESGAIDLHPDFVRFVRRFVEERVAGSGPAIDEPVTTDVHRLIRLPGSLHGASGLIVQPIARDELATFDPLTEAIAPMFQAADIAIEVAESTTVELGDSHHELEPGRQVVPEYVGIFLMGRGLAEKVRE